MLETLPAWTEPRLMYSEAGTVLPSPPQRSCQHAQLANGTTPRHQWRVWHRCQWLLSRLTVPLLSPPPPPPSLQPSMAARSCGVHAQGEAQLMPVSPCGRRNSHPMRCSRSKPWVGSSADMRYPIACHPDCSDETNGRSASQPCSAAVRACLPK